MSGPMNKNDEFNAKMALTFAEFFDGVSPRAQRMALRVRPESDELELSNPETQSTLIWRLSQMRRFDGVADDTGLTFTKDGTDEARLIVQEVGALRAILGANPNMKLASGGGGKAGKALLFAGAALGVIAGLVLFVVPTMAARATDMVSVEQEMAFGEQMFDLVYTQSGFDQCSGPEGQQALDQMAARLTQYSDIDVPLTLRVVNDPLPQATALPGGHITVYSGLIDLADDANEVAAVLAHEIGHVVHRDGTRAGLQALGSFGLVGLAFGDIFGTTVAAGLAQTLVSSSHSREAETNADAYAHDMLDSVGISPSHLAGFFQRLEEQGMASDLGVFQHLSTHPELSGRIDASLAAADGSMTADSPILSESEWASLRAICDGPVAPPEILSRKS